MLSKVKITNRIWSITADTQEEIAKAFIRFQEYYENPKLKGNKGLTVTEIERWWDGERPDDLKDESYYQAWCGFNLPGRVFLETMLSPKFRPAWNLNDIWTQRFWKEEDALLDQLYNLSIDDIVTGYFIGTSKDSDDVLDHEVAHGFFTTNLPYKTSQLANIAKLPNDIYSSLRDDLLSMGYDRSVIHDEVQAYLSTYTENLADVFGSDKYNAHTSAFVETFNQYRSKCDDVRFNSDDEDDYDYDFEESPCSLMDEHLTSNQEGTGSSPVKGATFTLNAVTRTVANDDLSYDDIIELAGYKRGQVLTVIFYNRDTNFAASLRPGQHITVRPCISIDVGNTSNA